MPLWTTLKRLSNWLVCLYTLKRSVLAEIWTYDWPANRPWKVSLEPCVCKCTRNSAQKYTILSKLLFYTRGHDLIHVTVVFDMWISYEVGGIRLELPLDQWRSECEISSSIGDNRNACAVVGNGRLKEEASSVGRLLIGLWPTHAHSDYCKTK